MRPQTQCDEHHPGNGYRCQLNPHPSTIKHYAVSFERPPTYWTWENDEILETWPDGPEGVSLVTSAGERLPVDLIYLGKRHKGGDVYDVWETVPPCSRTDIVAIHIDRIPAKSAITIGRK